ncbi:unnamed protein product [Ceratitis capitata]|uniref:(Mediterranean fruit fly) hypothetical protein n=1 Tax=Ceratitis capitata TaxID=7213 RepID=A0A811UWQ6_CERCA|nr:unnamed protein product [Ceratitis capitata]
MFASLPKTFESAVDLALKLENNQGDKSRAMFISNNQRYANDNSNKYLEPITTVIITITEITLYPQTSSNINNTFREDDGHNFTPTYIRNGNNKYRPANKITVSIKIGKGRKIIEMSAEKCKCNSGKRGRPGGQQITTSGEK